MILILTTANNKSAAHKIGSCLLKIRLIACYSLTPVESAYWWKGKIEKSKEFMLILKAQKKNYEKIELQINKLSNYENPEIISIKPEKVAKKYQKWLLKETV